MFKKIFTATIFLLATTIGMSSAQNYYDQITPKVDNIYDPDKIEVVTIFSYACPACNNFEPLFQNWKESQADNDYLTTISLAAPGQGTWSLYAQAFYTLEAMNELERGHQAFFNAIHKERKRFINANQIADFMQTQGIDRDKFLKAWGSFGAKSSFNRAEELIANQYQVPFTPAVIIDGQYLLSADKASRRPGNENAYQKLIMTMNEVIEKVKNDRGISAEIIEVQAEEQ